MAMTSEAVIAKTQQISDGTRRPPSEAQIASAALDVEVLVPLYERFTRIQPELGSSPTETS